MRTIADLTPDPRNANKGTPRGRALLEQSLRKLGAGRSILVDKHGVTIAGNKTLEIAAELGLAVREVETDGKELVVVRRMDLDLETDVAARELGVADNRTAEIGLAWDGPTLEELGIDLKPWFFEDELKKIGIENGGNGALGEDPGPQLDKAEELREKWGTQLGQLWALGEHRLLCGDSTRQEDVERVMGGERAILLHADPPYGMGKEKEGIANDNLYGAKLDAFQMQWWRASRPSLEDNASAYMWGNPEDLWRLWFVGGLQQSERLTFRCQVVWDKVHGQGMTAGEFRTYPTATEHCLFFMLGEQGFNINADNYWGGWEPIRGYLDNERQKMGWSNKQIADWFGFHPRMADHWFSKSQWSFPTQKQYEHLQSEARHEGFKRDYEELKRDFYVTRSPFNNTHDSMTDVWRFERVQGEERWEHATPKPVPMIERILKSSAPEHAVALEPFLGSGTTLIACERLKRKCRALEISPAYVAVALQRFYDLTKVEPKLL